MSARDPYRPARHPAPADLCLDSNEARPPRALRGVVGAPLERYPDTRALRETLARRLALAPEQLLITAGADDGLLRAALAYLRPGEEALVCTPTFEMIPRYVAMAGARLCALPLGAGGLPLEAMIEASSERTRLVFVVSPNNPTGGVASAEELLALRAALPAAVIVLDHAYVELADEDLTPVALSLPRVLVLRTLSKAWGLAGLRVGYALGAARELEQLAAVGNPYPVSAASAALALERLVDGEDDMLDYVSVVRRERAALWAELVRLGLEALPSEANFVFARGARARWLRDGLAGLGIAVRAFDREGELAQAVRITCPGRATDFARLVRGLRTVLEPEALLFELDSVLGDVERSPRATVAESAQRSAVAPPARAQLESWRERLPLAIVTCRPREDALRLLERAGWLELFDVLVAREDCARLAPDPQPVRAALERLGVERAWMLAGTRDGVCAARGAAVLPLGVVADQAGSIEQREQLLRDGAARTLREWTLDLNELLELCQ